MGAKNMVALVRSGRWFDKDAFKEIGKILKNKNTVCAIIPEDEEHVMAPLMFRFFQAFEEQEHGVLRNRNIFLGIQVLISDSDDVEETPMPTPTSKPKAPKAPKMTPTSELSPPSSPPRDPLTEFYESRPPSPGGRARGRARALPTPRAAAPPAPRGGVRGIRGPRTSAAEAQARHALADNAAVVVLVAGPVFGGRGEAPRRS